MLLGICTITKTGAAENPVGGAINVVLPHPTNPNILFVGGVYGGVWRTFNAVAAVQDWEPITDFESSLSIGAMAFDAADPSGNTLIIGLGRNSSLRYEGGGRKRVAQDDRCVGRSSRFHLNR